MSSSSPPTTIYLGRVVLLEPACYTKIRTLSTVYKTLEEAKIDLQQDFCRELVDRLPIDPITKSRCLRVNVEQVDEMGIDFLRAVWKRCEQEDDLYVWGAKGTDMIHATLWEYVWNDEEKLYQPFGKAPIYRIPSQAQTNADSDLYSWMTQSGCHVSQPTGGHPDAFARLYPVSPPRSVPALSDSIDWPYEFLLSEICFVVPDCYETKVVSRVAIALEKDVAIQTCRTQFVSALKSCFQSVGGPESVCHVPLDESKLDGLGKDFITSLWNTAAGETGDRLQDGETSFYGRVNHQQWNKRLHTFQERTATKRNGEWGPLYTLPLSSTTSALELQAFVKEWFAPQPSFVSNQPRTDARMDTNLANLYIAQLVWLEPHSWTVLGSWYQALPSCEAATQALNEQFLVKLDELVAPQKFGITDLTIGEVSQELLNEFWERHRTWSRDYLHGHDQMHGRVFEFSRIDSSLYEITTEPAKLGFFERKPLYHIPSVWYHPRWRDFCREPYPSTTEAENQNQRYDQDNNDLQESQLELQSLTGDGAAVMPHELFVIELLKMCCHYDTHVVTKIRLALTLPEAIQTCRALFVQEHSRNFHIVKIHDENDGSLDAMGSDYVTSLWNSMGDSIDRDDDEYAMRTRVWRLELDRTSQKLVPESKPCYVVPRRPFTVGSPEIKQFVEEWLHKRN